MKFSTFLLSALLLSTAAAPLVASQRAPEQPSAQAAKPIESAERNAAVRQFAALLRARYVDPATGARYATALEQAAERGDYNNLTDANAFAARVTEDLRAVSPDKHLRISVGNIPAQGRGTQATRLLPDLEARWAAPGIAWLAINASPADPAVAAKAERLLLAHADARALVLDLRQNSGGAGVIMNTLFPYLFGKPTPLLLMDTRAEVEADIGAPDEGPSLRRVASPKNVVRREHVALPHPSEKRLLDMPVYVLTSAKTASVAEAMTLALKRTRRATIVGETTSGAGHYGSFARVGERFVAFVPFGRTLDPDTGRGWEGVGVEPDISVPADQALEAALKLANAPARVARSASALVPVL